MIAHPRTFSRGTKPPDPSRVRALVYAPRPERMEWIESELSRANAGRQVASGIAGIVAALVDDPAPRPQILVVDLDSLTAVEILELHAIRERGWTGTVVALGRVGPSLRRSLRVTRAIVAPFLAGSLTDEIQKFHSATSQMTTQIPCMP
jgi:hypothetical protein